jgi:hypothetical protein
MLALDFKRAFLIDGDCDDLTNNKILDTFSDKSYQSSEESHNEYENLHIDAA